VPVVPVHSIGEALEHPQAQARGMVVEVEHAEAGSTRALGCPLHFSATPTVEPEAAPALGQHSRAVLCEYGYRDAEIDALFAVGAVA
jgi:crotonobetainyl-CoA:carnitine CoA-transferase CaiB-like acyl-CoA transferase